MTRRERLERKAELRREWADKRRTKAAGEFKRAEPYRGDVAFNTQPGHIPERARVIAAIDRGHGHAEMAAHHDSKADGLEKQLERTIFSDDEDAIERLEAKARALEAEREQIKRVNAAWRKAGRPRPENSEGWRKVADLLGASDNDLAEVRKNMARDFIPREPFPSYVLQNKGAEIRRCRDRIEDVKKQSERKAEAEAAPNGVSIKRYPAPTDWATVTFSEKPPREVLEALKEAGYRWGSGHWGGALSRLPEAVEALEGGA